MAKKKATKEKTKSLEDILFACRDALRGKAQMIDKRDVLLTLVFLKFAGYNFEQQQKAIAEDAEKTIPGDENFKQMMLNERSSYDKAGVFWLDEDCRWETLRNLDPTVMNVEFDNCLRKLDNTEPKLKGTFRLGLFTQANLEPRIIKAVVDHVDEIDQSKFDVNHDLIGRVYEYFLQAFSINSDKEEGEFYTPQSVVELMANILEPFDGTLYDPCCGSGGMFVQSVRLIASKGGNTKAVNVYGQESEPATYRLAKLNLAARGISNDLGKKPASTFTDDQHKGKRFDYIMANPPFNLKNWRGNDELTDDYRWDGYAVPPASNANYAWILHIVSKLSANGKAGFLLANGALSGEGTELEIRQKLIENHLVEGIVILPRKMFYPTDISVTLWLLNKNKHARTARQNGRIISYRDRTDEVLFMDLRQLGEVYDKKFIRFSEDEIQKISQTVHQWQIIDGNYHNEDGYCYSATINEIEKQNWSLVPSKYIPFKSSSEIKDYDSEMKQIQSDLSSLMREEEESRKAVEDVFKKLGYDII